MRNLKKVLTLVLTVAMVLSIMVVGTGAAFSDQDSIKNKEAVDVCTTLNIIAGMEDGSYRPANNVTRAQMCKMICVALNGGKEPTLGTNATPTFSDVRTDPSSSWAESFIESCNSQGIVSGVGGGRFSPSGSVTGTQAARMLLVALGYRADIQGFTGESWAINVNTLASAKGLYKGIESIDANAALSRDNAAQMIWNALNAYEVEYVSQLVTVNGTLTSELVAQDKVVGSNRDKITMLEDKYEAETAIGIFAGNENTASNVKSGNIRITSPTINGNTVTSAGVPVTQMDFKYDLDLKYIGEEIKVLYRDNRDGSDGRLDDKDTIYGVYLTGETVVYNITKADLQDADNGKIKFNDTNYKAATNINVTTNYDTSATTPEAVTCFEKSGKYYKTCGDTIKFIEKDGSITDAYIVEYSLGRVTGTSSDKISITGAGSLKYDGNVIADGLQKDDVVTYSKWYNTANETYVVDKADVVTGNLDAYNISQSTVRIAGTTYDADDNSHFTNLGGASDFKAALSALSSGDLNSNVEAYMVNGCVLAMKIEDSVKNYALIDSIGGTGTKVDPYKVYLVLNDGTTKTYELSSDSTLTGSQIDTAINTNHGKVLITYTVTRDGQIKATNVGTAMAKAVYDKDIKTLKDDTTAIGVVDPDCVLFVRTDSANGKYSVYTNFRTLNNINASADAMYGLYNKDADNKVVAAYIDLNGKPAGASSDTVYGIITSDGYVTNEDDTIYTTFDVSANGETAILKFEADESDKASLPAKGDLVYFDKVADNVYSTSEIHRVARNETINSTPETGVTAQFVQVKEYNEGEILIYSTTATNTSGTVDWKSTTPLPLDDDMVITYVDAGSDKGGDNVGILQADTTNFDSTSKLIAMNAAIVVKDGKIIAIYVDVDRDIAQ